MDPNPIPDQSRTTLLIGCVLGAGFFSKVLGYLENPRIFNSFYDNFFYILLNKTIVGGLIGGLVGVEIAKKIIGIKRPTGDLFCFPVMLGMIIGRIGCFLAGPKDGTWGVVSQSFLAVDPGDGAARYPLPLYEIIFLMLLWAALKWLQANRRLQEGALFKLFMVSYLLWRFFIEWLKPPEVFSLFGISFIQFFCLMTLLYYRRVVTQFKTIILG